MKKIVGGLAGILIGGMSFFSGCKTSYSYNGQVSRIEKFHNYFNEIVGGDPNDSYYISRIQKKGNNYQIIARGEKNDKVVTYWDDNGNFMKRGIITIPKIFDIKTLPKDTKQRQDNLDKLLKEVRKKLEELDKADKEKLI